MDSSKEKPYHIEAIDGLRDNYTSARFRAEIGECRAVIAQVIAEDNRSDQIARVHMLRYLDLLLARAIRWSDEEADLMAIVLRSQIDLRAWAEFVSKGPNEAARFLNEVNIDIRELHETMDKAYPGVMEPLPEKITGKRVDFSRVDDQEAYAYKLCSKLIHPSALLILHPEVTIGNALYKEHLAVAVLFHAWYILTRFHDINWSA
ncbi:MAG TPA: hypothetical protein VN610_06350 [Bryobacteraceae bacterium]|nr:hypothetical protein [Bryobacteraceae bacterium]